MSATILIAMPPAMWPNPVKDHQYVQYVRKFKPSSLLPLVASTACKYQSKDQWLNSPYRVYTPWALADVTRVALAHGTEFNRLPATGKNLEAALGAYDALADPFLSDHDLHSFLLRKAGEQLTWQVSEFQMMTRSIALFSQTATSHQLKCLVPGWDIEIFGYPLADYIGTAQLVWASSIQCSGFFDPTFFDTRDGELTSQIVAKDTALQVIGSHFAGGVAEFRVEESLVSKRTQNVDPQLRRFTYNPLRGRPLITGYGDGFLCPVPQFLSAKVSPLGVYFNGYGRFKDQFSIELGYLFEAYIGRQLQLIKNVRLLSEIAYISNKSKALSVDWIVIFENLVLLVEVKSAIPTEPIRLGTPDAAAEITKKITKAYKKIDETAGLIRARHPDFRMIPVSCPILGMVVTLGSFHTGNSSWFQDLLPNTQTRIALVDAAEIEWLVTINDAQIDTLLLERDADAERSTWALTDALKDHATDTNPVLDAAWNATPWASVNRPS